MILIFFEESYKKPCGFERRELKFRGSTDCPYPKLSLTDPVYFSPVNFSLIILRVLEI